MATEICIVFKEAKACFSAQNQILKNGYYGGTNLIAAINSKHIIPILWHKTQINKTASY